MNKKPEIVVFERIERRIYLIRGQKVMLGMGGALYYWDNRLTGDLRAYTVLT